MTTTREEMKRIKAHNVCSECGAFLKLSLVDGKDALVCERFPEHKGYARHFEPRDLSINARRKQMTTEIGEKKTQALAKYSGVGQLTRDQAKEIVETIWPGAPKTEQLKAILLCANYQLNPLMKHVFLIPFKDKYVMVLGIQAQRLIAHRAGDFSYVDDTPRIMTEAEQARIFGKADPSKLWAITKLKDSKGNTASGYGFYPSSETPYGSDKGNSAMNMAFIRSERNAFDRLFAGKMPQVDVIDATYVEVEDVGKVDPGTGEVVETKPEPPPDAPEPKSSDVEVPMITPEQSKLIKDYIKTNRVRGQDVRDYTGKQSSKDLTEDEATKVLMAIQAGQLGKPLADTAKEIFPDAEEEN
uniref:Putative DNA recombination protein n=1 Tax=viral metagenome TaxID=1070528 RepID=A0A6M3LKH7_9ZZZZ